MKKIIMLGLAFTIIIIASCKKKSSDEATPCSLAADFTSSVNSADDQIMFTNSSVSEATQFTWTFGDNSVSTLANPSHLYSSGGTYSVKLTVKSADGKCSGEVTKSVIVPIIVEKKQMALMNKLTATWCGPCGSWGWTLFDDIITASANKAVFMGTYGDAGSNFYNSAAGAFKQQFDASAGWPAFCVNGRNRTAYSPGGGIYPSTTQTNVVNAIDSTYNAVAKINAGYTVTIASDSIRVITRTKFFSASTGEYYLGVYVIENGAMSIQTGQTGIVAHHWVLQGSFNSSQPFGAMIASGTISADATYNKNFAIKTVSTWDLTKVKVGVVVWKKNGTIYDYVNAHINP